MDITTLKSGTKPWCDLSFGRCPLVLLAAGKFGQFYDKIITCSNCRGFGALGSNIEKSQQMQQVSIQM
jgi:hypothetical protein